LVHQAQGHVDAPIVLAPSTVPVPANAPVPQVTAIGVWSPPRTAIWPWGRTIVPVHWRRLEEPQQRCLALLPGSENLAFHAAQVAAHGRTLVG
jgi:hypothetical protein